MSEGIKVVTFRQFMDKPRHTYPERMLVQAIARISTQEGYTHMTPEDIWELLANQVRTVDQRA